jgi:hypothetical protein
MDAGQLSVCLVRGARHPLVVLKETLAFDAADPLMAAEVLKHWLGSNAVSARVDFILGVAYVRYLTLPWSEQLADSAFREKLAHALLARNFQEEPGRFDVRFAPLRFQQPQAVVFVRRDLVNALREAGRYRGCKLGSIEPLLTVVWNRFHARLAYTKGDLLIAEPERLLVVRHDQGAPCDIRIQPFAAAKGGSVTGIGPGSEAASVFAPQLSAELGSDSASYLTLKPVQGWSPATDWTFGYALCGVC